MYVVERSTEKNMVWYGFLYGKKYCTYGMLYIQIYLLSLSRSLSLERERLRLLECLLRLVTLLPDELDEEEEEEERRLCFFLRRLRLSSSLSDE